VAWVTERKDALSTIFWLLGTGAWVRYARRPGAARYAAVVAWFALALLSKPMAVTFPFALLLLDLWPLGRLRAPGARRLVAEKAPLLAMAAASSAVTFAAQQGAGVVRTFERYTPGVRLANAAVAYVKYLALTLWPRGLAIYYPHPVGGLPAAAVVGASLLLAALTAVALISARRHPWLAVGWFWHLGTLVPAIGIVQVGDQALADRYSYLPAIGLVPALVWEATQRARRWRRGPALLTAAGAVATALFALLTSRQLDSWRDGRSLYGRALTVMPTNALAHYNLAVLDASEGRVEQALEHYRAAARAAPDFGGLRVNFGLLLASAGRAGEAENQYREALRIDPANPEAHVDFGVLLAGRRRYDEAIEHYRAALAVRPGMVAARMNLGNALDDSGRRVDAVREYREALRLAPGDAEVHFNLGLALEKGGRREEGRAEYREALRLDPSHAGALRRLGGAPQ
jgi:Flp pilus assembly protein TadD